MSHRLQSITVVGASLAGLRAVEALRRAGYDGRLNLIGAESHLPYDRPPLSKAVLQGSREPDTVALTQDEKFAALELDLRLGTRATSLDLQERRVGLEDGESLPFDGLMITTGAAARTLPNTPDLAGIHTLRSLDDCLAIRAELDRQPRVAIVGAGFIGAEVAATCRERGLDVTMIETLPTPLANALPPAIGDMVAAVHRDQGVELRCGVSVAGMRGSQRVEVVDLDDGSEVPADLVVVGIGVVPETSWLEGSGLEIANGVVCDETCAAAEDVVAAGDVARWNNVRFGESMRVEHWTNAVEQGEAAAERLLHGPDGAEPFAPVPYVWSDQYDRKLMSVGRIRPDDEMQVFHGSLEERRFVALFGRDGQLVGAFGANRAPQLMRYRRMLRENAPFDEAVAQASS
ncbi:FAD-dependent oxidoreductase [Myxococcota bacterium]|nr:FAD-dependent oxidoreductase [Myxococcota bacterium]